MSKPKVKRTPGAFGSGKQQNSLQEQSMKRTEILANNLFEAIDKTSKEVEGDLTVAEMLDVTLRIAHNFNKRALLSEFEKEAIVVDMQPKTDA
jgi:hypothetical protein